MTTREFSNEFDTLLNSYSQTFDFGKGEGGTDITLDEYQKSKFLTDAQEQLILSYYNGKNSYLESFEQTEEMRRYLGTLVRTEKLTPEENTSDLILIDENSAVIALPSRLWFITYEKVKFANDAGTCAAGKSAQVIPTTQDNLYRTLENPFKGPSLRRVLRLDIESNQIELISKYKIAEYTVRYLEYVSPIVLSDLEEGLSIRGVDTETECAFPEPLHRTILELAVTLAKNAFSKQVKQ